MLTANNILVTKIHNISDRNVQRKIAYFKSGHLRITNAFFRKNAFFLKFSDGEKIKIGEVKNEYIPFLESLENPRVKIKITGGQFELVDRLGGSCGLVESYSDLTQTERVKLAKNELKSVRRTFGMNVLVYDEIQIIKAEMESINKTKKEDFHVA